MLIKCESDECRWYWFECKIQIRTYLTSCSSFVECGRKLPSVDTVPLSKIQTTEIQYGDQQRFRLKLNSKNWLRFSTETDRGSAWTRIQKELNIDMMLHQVFYKEKSPLPAWFSITLLNFESNTWSDGPIGNEFKYWFLVPTRKRQWKFCHAIQRTNFPVIKLFNFLLAMCCNAYFCNTNAIK